MVKTIYIDLDGVIVDIERYINQHYTKKEIDLLGIGEIVDIDTKLFHESPPIEDAIESFNQLASDPRFNVWILTTAPWENPESLTAKRIWVEKHLGKAAYKRIIFSHNKGLLKGDYLIDDRIKNGVAEFEGEHIHFGQKGAANWKEILKYLK